MATFFNDLLPFHLFPGSILLPPVNTCETTAARRAICYAAVFIFNDFYLNICSLD